MLQTQIGKAWQQYTPRRAALAFRQAGRGFRRWVQHDQRRWLMVGETAGCQGEIAEYRTFGDHQTDGARLRIFGNVFTDPEDRRGRQQTWHRVDRKSTRLRSR